MARLGGVDGVHRRDDNDHVVVADRRPADTVQLGQTRCAADGLAARPGVVPLIVGTYAAYIGATVSTDYFNVDVIRTLDGALAAEVDQLPLFERETVLREICDWASSSVSSAPPCASPPNGPRPRHRHVDVDRTGVRAIDVAVRWRRVRRDPGSVARVLDLRRFTAGDLRGAGDPGVVAGCHRA
jgi:hypothetical protein